MGCLEGCLHWKRKTTTFGHTTVCDLGLGKLGVDLPKDKCAKFERRGQQVLV